MKPLSIAMITSQAAICFSTTAESRQGTVGWNVSCARVLCLRSLCCRFVTRRAAGRYQDLDKDERGWLWCEVLGLWFGSWPGEILRETAPWLRFYDPYGNLVLLPEKREQQRAEFAERQRDAERQEKEQERQARLDSVSRLLALGLGVAEVAAALDLPAAVVEQIRDAAE